MVCLNTIHIFQYVMDWPGWVSNVLGLALMERPAHPITSTRVACLLLGYLSAYPDARDTAEGIAQWWLRAHAVNAHETTVREALKELVASGWLIAKESRSRPRLYSLNVARKSDLQRSYSPL